jgi:ATP-dependent Lon protease
MFELPIFALRGAVLFPGCVLKLRISTPEERRMLAAVLASQACFCVVNLSETTGLAQVGCLAQVVHCEQLADGESNILVLGLDPLSVLSSRIDSYLLGMVETLQENYKSVRAYFYAKKAAALLNNVLYLLSSLHKTPLPKVTDSLHSPQELSFIIASSLPDVPEFQQELLEMRDTEQRLAAEMRLLSELHKRIRALVAIEEAFAAAGPATGS